MIKGIAVASTYPFANTTYRLFLGNMGWCLPILLRQGRYDRRRCFYPSRRPLLCSVA